MISDFARRNKPKVSEEHEGERPERPPNLNSSLNNLWVNGPPDGGLKKPLRLEALPNIERHRRSQRLNSLDVL